MIKALGRTGTGEPLLILGLSAENIRRLTDDQPIMVSTVDAGLAEAGVDIPAMEIVIVAGPTEGDVLARLVKAGLVTLPTTDCGYQIDHAPVASRCCEMHNTNCEPPAELCCDDCRELSHYKQLNHVPCVLDRCTCTSVQQHLDSTQPGYAGAGIGKREPLRDGVVSASSPAPETEAGIARCSNGCPAGECYCPPDGSEPRACGHGPGGACPLGHCYACDMCYCNED